MTDEHGDDYSCTLRDHYGFPVQPAYAALHHAFAPIWAQEEAERTERWERWLDSLRASSPSVGGKDVAVERLVERALLCRGTTPGGAAGAAERGPHPAGLLRQLRALVQMGVPMSRRAQFWRLFLGIEAKRKEGEYRRLVGEAIPHERGSDGCAGWHGSPTLAPEGSALSDRGGSAATPPTLPSDADGAEETERRPGTPALTHSGRCAAPSAAGSPSVKPLRRDLTADDTDWLAQIEKDLHRTFPDNPLMDSSGRAALRRVLAAYSARNPSVGYCQGLNFLAAAFLLLLPEEDAFWCVAAAVEDLLQGYFDLRMIAPQVDTQVFNQLLRSAAPNVAAHLAELEVDPASATSAWFLVAFLNSLPLESCLRVWDVFFLERSPALLFRVGLALVDIYSQALMATTDCSDAYMLLQALGPMTFDASRLLDTACIGYAHIHDSVVRALRDEHRPAVLEGMKGWLSSDDDDAGGKEILSCSPSRACAGGTGSLAARGAPTAAVHRRRSGSPRSPLAASKGALAAPPARLVIQQGRIEEEEEEEEERAGVPPAASLQPAAEHVDQRQGGMQIPTADQVQVSLTDVRSPFNPAPPAPPSSFTPDAGLPSPPPRRTRSAAMMGASPSPSGHRPHRIDLMGLVAFVPDMRQPAVQAAFHIAANPSPKLMLAAAAGGGNAVAAGRQGGGPSAANYSRTPLALAFSTRVLEADSAASRHPDGEATIDIGSLAQTMRRLNYRGAGRPSEGQGDPGMNGSRANPSGIEYGDHLFVPRRFTDGGALLMPSLARRGGWEPSLHTIPSMQQQPHPADASPRPQSPGTPEEKGAQLVQLRERLQAEVVAAQQLRAAAEADALEQRETAAALAAQHSKVGSAVLLKEAELEEKRASIAATDGALAGVQKELRQGQNRAQALAARKSALAGELARRAAVMRALMKVVGRASSTPPVSPCRSPRVSGQH